MFGDTGRYKAELIAISNDGCVDTFYNEIIVKGETTFYIPNAFTPNNDGNNETFTGYGIGIIRADFFIFDRWGKLVYQSNTLEKGWNGTYQNSGDECPEGTYVYLFKVFNGQPAPLEISGKVTLVR
ncbi:MAG: gliding motility-associated C-terminal domain-containing protein [Bacteroidetes bacterium]|nr:gliding motility-associated C-terminal domain-containing protein [Bacteroidota bacterium]